MAETPIIEGIQPDTTEAFRIGPKSDNPELRRNIAKIGEGIADGIGENRAALASEAFAETVEDALTRANEDEFTDQGIQHNNAAYNDLQGRIAKHQFAIEQGDDTLVARTAGDVKTKLAELKVRFPAQARRLEQEFGTFIRTNPALDQLGLLETERKQRGQVEQQQYDRILDFATDKLGMNLGTHPPGSEQFALEYLRLSAQNNVINDNEILQAARSAKANQTVHELAEDMKSTLVGHRMRAQQRVMDARKVALDATEFLATGSAPDLAKANEYELVMKPRALAQVDDAIGVLERSFFETTTTEMRAAPSFAGIQDQLDSAVDHLKFLREGLEANDVTALKIWEGRQLVRVANLREKLPRMDNLNLLFEAGGKLFSENIWDTLSDSDVIIRNRVGMQANHSVAEFFAYMYKNGGQGEDYSDLTPFQIREQLRRNMSIQPAPFEVDSHSTDEQGQMQAADDYVGLVFNKLDKITDNADPLVAQTTISSLGATLDYLRGAGPNKYPELQETFLDGYSSPQFHNAVALANSDQTNHHMMVPAGDSAQDTWIGVPGGHNGRIATLAAIGMESVPGNIAANTLIVMTDEGVGPNGHVRYIIDEEAFKAYTPEPARAAGVAKLTAGKSTNDPGGLKPAIRRDLEDKARQLSNQVTRSLRTQGGIFMQRNPDAPITPQFWEELFNTQEYWKVARVPVDTDGSQ